MSSFGSYDAPFDLDPGPGITMPPKPSATASEIWINGFSAAGEYRWTRMLPGAKKENLLFTRATALKSGVRAVGSVFADRGHFGPSPGVDNRTSHGRNDIFVSTFKLLGQQ